MLGFSHPALQAIYLFRLRACFLGSEGRRPGWRGCRVPHLFVYAVPSVCFRRVPGNMLKAGDFARAQASGVRCVPLLVETFGGLSPPLVDALHVRRRGVAQEQADGV